jgi:DNA methylase
VATQIAFACPRMTTTTSFEQLTGDRLVPNLGTNSGAEPLAFQSWHRFKEAFPPELIQRVLGEEREIPESCLDPFGGSGTTALASQFLGVSSTTIEVNPFLVDVIRAKVESYDSDLLVRDFGLVCRRAAKAEVDPARHFGALPPSFLEPGAGGERWLFDAEVAAQLARLLSAIEGLKTPSHRRLFMVLVGGLLAEVSNVVVSGKGRRYRRDWQERRRPAAGVMPLFAERAQGAIADVHRFADRPKVRAEVRHEDARATRSRRMHEIAIFSPPYPNSFDYTDVYNLELWMLGYLRAAEENRELRESTLTSHVQLHRDYAAAPSGSPLLDQTQEQLQALQEDLWNRSIPAMVGGYFADLLLVMAKVRARLREGGRCCIVIGDSRYGGVLVPSAKILAQLIVESGWELCSEEPVRAMRSSAQQGGSNLEEALLILRRED